MATIAGTAGDLRRMLAENDIPDDAPILVSDVDHSYRRASARISWAAHDRAARWWGEYHSDEHLEDGEEKRDALIVG